MHALYPTAEQFAALAAFPDDTPVVMVNLLRFKDKADAPDEGLSGEDAYRRYSVEMIKFVESKGGRVIWSGRIDSQVVGTQGEGFHMVGLVEYPSRKAFMEIATSDHVREIGVHRAAGLEGQWLLASTESK